MLCSSGFRAYDSQTCFHYCYFQNIWSRNFFIWFHQVLFWNQWIFFALWWLPIFFLSFAIFHIKHYPVKIYCYFLKLSTALQSAPKIITTQFCIISAESPSLITCDFLCVTLLLIQGGVITLKTGRREVPGSNRGRACRPSRSEFSVVFSETRVNTG